MNTKSKDKNIKIPKDNKSEDTKKTKVDYNEKIVVDASFEQLIKELVTPIKK